MKRVYLLLVLAVAIAGLLRVAGTGAPGTAPIDSLSGGDRVGVLLVLGVFLFGSLWRFGSRVGRYHKSGDPIQVHYVDARQDRAARSSDTAKLPTRSGARRDRGAI